MFRQRALAALPAVFAFAAASSSSSSFARLDAASEGSRPSSSKRPRAPLYSPLPAGSGKEAATKDDEAAIPEEEYLELVASGENLSATVSLFPFLSLNFDCVPLTLGN
jgi:hypothetical protein